MAKKFPKSFQNIAAKADEYMRGSGLGGTLFEELCLYVGPIDGHNLDHLLPVLRNLESAEWDGPVFLHVVTKKGTDMSLQKNQKINIMEWENSMLSLVNK